MKEIFKKTIAVGLSGGVDSAVTALILKLAGFKVVGVFMQNWDNFLNNDFSQKETNHCSIKEDYEDAKRIANHLNIELHKVDFIKEYWNDVFQNMISDYKKNLTPNPDVLCNKYVKFGCFRKFCETHLNVDYIATGHYAKIEQINNTLYLKEAVDQNKDQTYFLSELNQEQLKKVLFPLGDFTKRQIREIAEFYNLPVWNKKDSTGICFIGERDFALFLKNYLPINKGPIVDYVTKQIVGEHDGLYFYTNGQRKNLKLFQTHNSYFVVNKEPFSNTLYVVQERKAESFLRSFSCEVNDFNWISLIPKNNNVLIKFRHSANKTQGVFSFQENTVRLLYPDGARAVTEGQYAVLYQNGICLGGGKITKVIFEKNEKI